MNERMRIQRKRKNTTAFPTVRSDTLQRSPTAPEQAVDEVPPIVQDVLSSSGQPLDANAQDFMESRFGHDFSKVRVHTDEKAGESAQAVNALAYTVGSDVVFGQGHYEPGTSEGKKLLAHELTHVVQQAPEPVGSTPVTRGLSLSKSSDGQEVEANEIASRVADQASDGQIATSSLSIQRNPGSATLHRFQAGDTGHGGIEEHALTQSGFTADEASKVYFGNWLRDLSQVPPSILPLINILALGEFGREITKEDLGTYVPSEHLDNPEGGKTYEDQLQKDPAKQKEAWDTMSSAQKAAYIDEQKHIGEIENATRESGLPEYIEVGKFHAKRKLAEAITLGRTPEGMQAMGNGLHAVEDYFSHSNFLEVAIWNLFDKGEITREQYNNLTYTPLGNDAATIGGKDQIDPRQPAIITGTYASANNIVSQLELLTTEVQHGQLTAAFIKGVFIKYGITAVDIVKKAVEGGGDIGQKLLGTIGGWAGGAIGAVGGGIAGGIAGAGQGAVEGWREHSGLSAVGHAFTGLFSGAASGVAEGAREGWHGGENVGQAVGGAIGQGIGSVVGLAAGLTLDALIALLGTATLLLLFPIVAIAMVAYLAAVKLGIIETIAQAKTAQAGQQARKEDLGPSHSELAKDAPDHHLFTIAVKLAEFADQDIGDKMIAAWKTRGSDEQTPLSEPVSPETEKTVTELVDKYVSHPSRDNWWHDPLIPLLKK